MIISLYTSRVILQTLGVSDYGIYGIVGGLVTMFGFFNSSMTGTTSRFLTYELGKENKQRLKETFSTAFVLHIVIALIVVFLCEIIGVWFLEHKLVIPHERMFAARWVFQLSIFSMIFNIMQVPFNSLIISHEKMGIFAYIDISNSLLKLLIVYLLLIGHFDKLILYSILTCFVSLIVAIIYCVVSLRLFDECSLKLICKKEILKPMASFSGWELYGSLSLMAITQGVNMLLNMWFGTIMNAAYDIASRVQSMVMSLSTNVTTAIRPQIVKNYSIQEYSRSLSLARNGARITFLLMLLFTVPLLTETHYILNLWLGLVPQYVETLLRFSLIWNLTVAMVLTQNDVVNATGDVKWICLSSGTMYLAIIPITYVAFKLGAPYWFPFLLNVLTVMTGSLYSSNTIKKHIPSYSWTKIVFPDLMRNYFVLGVVLFLAFSITHLIEESFLRLMFCTFTNAILVSLLGFRIVLPCNLRHKILNHIKNKYIKNDWKNIK